MLPVYQLFYNNLPLTNNYAYIADANIVSPTAPYCVLCTCVQLSLSSLHIVLRACSLGVISCIQIDCSTQVVEILSAVQKWAAFPRPLKKKSKCNHLFSRFNYMVKNQKNKSKGHFLTPKFFPEIHSCVSHVFIWEGASGVLIAYCGQGVLLNYRV